MQFTEQNALPEFIHIFFSHASPFIKNENELFAALVAFAYHFCAMNLCFHFLLFMKVEHTNTDSIIHAVVVLFLSRSLCLCFHQNSSRHHPIMQDNRLNKILKPENSMNKLKCTFFHVKHLVVRCTADTRGRGVFRKKFGMWIGSCRRKSRENSWKGQV